MKFSACKLHANCYGNSTSRNDSTAEAWLGAKRQWSFVGLAFALVVFSASLSGCVNETGGDTYPSKPITIIVPYAPGGGGDTFTRAIAVQAQEILGTKIFVENRTGGSGTIGVGSVARAAADGYTLAFVSSSPVVMAPNFLGVPYDPAEDFTYLSRFVVTANPVLVSADSPYQTYSQLLDYARANPGRLRWSTAGINGASHVATLAAFQQEDVEAAFVPMQGSSEVMAGLLGGNTDVGVISDYGSALVAGDIRVLVEIGPEPIPELPEVPTFKQLGYPLTPSIFFGLAGPAPLPDDVIGKWEEAMRAITASEVFQDITQRLNGRVAFLGHEDFERHVLADIEDTRRALKLLETTE